MDDIERNPKTVIDEDKELSKLDSILFGKFLRSSTLRKSKRGIQLEIYTSIYNLDRNQKSN